MIWIIKAIICFHIVVHFILETIDFSWGATVQSDKYIYFFRPYKTFAGIFFLPYHTYILCTHILLSSLTLRHLCSLLNFAGVINLSPFFSMFLHSAFPLVILSDRCFYLSPVIFRCNRHLPFSLGCGIDICLCGWKQPFRLPIKILTEALCSYSCAITTLSSFSSF